MKILDFLTLLRDRDIQIQADGDRLRCNGPTGALTPELRQELQRRKSEILKFLRSAEALAQQQRAIVPLQPRGTAAPIFAAAGHNGDVFCFRALARHLGNDQPFFGLQPPGLDGNREPLTRIEDLASYFATQIRAVHPEGPCVIAGYCAGGTIAFELARQLVRDGAEIRFLALFGSPFPTWYRLLPQLRELLGQTASRVVRHARAVALLPVAELRTYIAERLNNLKTARVAEHPATPDPVLAWRDKVGRATLSAIRRYTPGTFSGRLNLFWPGREWRGGGDAPAQWPSIAPDTEIHFGPDDCNGATMLLEPCAAAFAGLFKTCLQFPAKAHLDRAGVGVASAPLKALPLGNPVHSRFYAIE
jgi:thioesterase domain-containing protein